MEKFISDSPVKTPEYHVKLVNYYGSVEHEFLAPAGLQLPNYLSSLYPEYSVQNGRISHIRVYFIKDADEKIIYTVYYTAY